MFGAEFRDEKDGGGSSLAGTGNKSKENDLDNGQCKLKFNSEK